MDLFCEVLFINLPNLKTVNNNSESQQILIKSMEKSSEVVAAADLPSSDWIFKVVWKCLWKIAGLMEDLFLGSQWSIILGYRRLSVKFLFTSLFPIFPFLLQCFPIFRQILFKMELLSIGKIKKRIITMSCYVKEMRNRHAVSITLWIIFGGNLMDVPDVYHHFSLYITLFFLSL